MTSLEKMKAKLAAIEEGKGSRDIQKMSKIDEKIDFVFAPPSELMGGDGGDLMYQVYGIYVKGPKKKGEDNAPVRFAISRKTFGEDCPMLEKLQTYIEDRDCAILVKNLCGFNGKPLAERYFIPAVELNCDDDMIPKSAKGTTGTMLEMPLGLLNKIYSASSKLSRGKYIGKVPSLVWRIEKEGSGKETEYSFEVGEKTNLFDFEGVDLALLTCPIEYWKDRFVSDEYNIALLEHHFEGEDWPDEDDFKSTKDSDDEDEKPTKKAAKKSSKKGKGKKVAPVLDLDEIEDED